MVDRASRDRLATALRQYVSGRVTNEELDDVDVDWRDSGAVAVKERAWNLYDDTYQHKAVGKHYVPRPDRKEIGRWILFLHSDQEYTWPQFSFMQTVNGPLNLLTFGWWERRKQRRFDEFMAAGDFAVWPFAAIEDYDTALTHPRYLSRQHA